MSLEGMLPPWQRRDNFGLAAHQRHIDRTNQFSAVTPTGNVEIMAAPSGTGFVERPQTVRLWTFPVTVEKDGGANGTATTVATYTYTVRTPDGVTTLGTAVALTRPRAKGMVIFQPSNTGYGLAFYRGTTLILWDAGEVEDTDQGCVA